ncbi:uncharacterized protein LOC105156620 [Sesamum indicum]|uniref:Uncharacterized protein LOC105156620 n=1 Tax=Sesamum indicum TaxID=4182 RepID=A0A6I9SMC7_SESIN|nr:uncharacterized protein LOC105156620 [Sesamum indicum]XP_020547769.1 uncharacterized protein LOC105156620 [Sesamum indicum]
MTADTTAPSYWLNWRFLLCAIWILVAMVLSVLVIWRYEGHNKSRNRLSGDQQEAARGLYKGEAWRTCSQSIHPIWLLAYRIVAFGALLALILADTIVHSVGIFYFYTQWTFTLVTVYFGLASSLSTHGHLLHRHELDSEKDNRVGRDAEQGSYVAPTHGENSDTPSTNRSLNPRDDPNHRTASVWENALQIMFQMCAGAVVLTDAVFWLVIYPFLTGKDYRLSFLVVCMHSVNAVFLLGETILNSLRFPFFRIAYFVLWTSVFVVFQWIIHACVSMRWPYPFLDLSSPYAPIWYLSVGLLHFPCFAIFTLIFKIKQFCVSR